MPEPVAASGAPAGTTPPAGAGAAGTGTGGAAGTGTGGVAGAPEPVVPAPPSWDSLKGHIPAEHAKSKMWESVKDIPTLLKNYAEAQQYIGGAVKIPKADSGQAAWDDFYTKLGRPAAADGYKPVFPELPGGLEWDQDFVKAGLASAHASGMTPAQVQAWINMYAEQAGKQVGTRAEQTKATLKALETAIGPGYEKELAYGQAAVKQLGGEKVMAAIANSGLGNDVDFIKMMIRIGRELGEDNVIDVSAVRQTEADAQSKINGIMKDKTHAYFNVQDPGHERAVNEVNRLFGMLHTGVVGKGNSFSA